MNTQIASVSVRNISRDRQQAVLSFRGDLECNENALKEEYKTIVDKILNKSYSIKVTEESQLFILINNAINSSNLDYVENIIIVSKFLVIKPELFGSLPQTIPSFFPNELEKFHEIIVSKILKEHDVIEVIGENQLLNLNSHAFEDKYPSYIKEIAPKLKTYIKHSDTLILKLPLREDQLHTLSKLTCLEYKKNKLKIHKNLPNNIKVLIERDLNIVKYKKSLIFTSDADDDTELRYRKKSTSKRISSLEEQRLPIQHRITQVKDLPLSEYPQQTNLYYRANSIIELEEIHKTIVGKILSERDVIVVTKDDQLLDLLSDAVEDIDLSYIKQIAVKLKSFLPEPESTVEHHATLVKNFPLSAAEDLACSSEFTFGNLWFLIPSDDTNIDQCDNDVISDIKKLSTFIIDELPLLKNEAVASPAMYDGLEILWFKPDHDVFRKKVCGSSITFLNGT